LRAITSEQRQAVAILDRGRAFDAGRCAGSARVGGQQQHQPDQRDRLARPSTSGTLTLSPTGAVTTSGGVTGNQAIAQGSTGPTPGTFSITAGSNQAFTVFGPITFNISNGAATMPVTLLTGALQQQSNNGTTVNYLLTVGGTLSVAGNQAIGAYSGSYTLTTVYQ
jgi:hypothetical protein